MAPRALTSIAAAVLASVALTGCANLNAAWRGLSTGRSTLPPPHAPSEEAARFEFPLGLPAEERVVVPGKTAAAIQLAMDDFLPSDTAVPPTATPYEQCLLKRASYDASAAPGPDGVILVSFSLAPGTCEGPPVMDLGATYAIDVRQWRILAVQH